VDMPGYGFAFASEEKLQAWRALMRGYLGERGALRKVFLVVDARHGLMPADREMVDFLCGSRVPFQVVLSKADLLRKEDLARRWWHVNEELKGRAGYVREVHMVSAVTGAGMAALASDIYRSSAKKGKN